MRNIITIVMLNAVLGVMQCGAMEEKGLFAVEDSQSLRQNVAYLYEALDLWCYVTHRPKGAKLNLDETINSLRFSILKDKLELTGEKDKEHYELMAYASQSLLQEAPSLFDSGLVDPNQAELKDIIIKLSGGIMGYLNNSPALKKIIVADCIPHMNFPSVQRSDASHGRLKESVAVKIFSAIKTGDEKSLKKLKPVITMKSNITKFIAHYLAEMTAESNPAIGTKSVIGRKRHRSRGTVNPYNKSQAWNSNLSKISARLS